jgi:aryl-alcohol dehydrogenase-like predicted oxidoreductase
MSDHLHRRDFVRTTAAAAAGVGLGLRATYTVRAGNPDGADTRKIVNYNSDMEYRRCGRTGLMVSAVCLGGHWKRIDTVVPSRSDFDTNRAEVVSRCIDRGVNYVDACTGGEVMAYAKALKGRREKMFFGFSWYEREVRFGEWRTFEKLKQSFDEGLQKSGLEYVDLWRITCHEQSGRHPQGEVEEFIKALDWAKKSGRARFTGISSHDRPHIKMLIETYPDQLEVIVTPYTAKTKVVTDESGLWAAMQKLDVGWFGIKPFASNSVFKGNSAPTSPTFEEDNRIARLAIRYILCNPAITAPIPGLITTEQVDNVALAVAERRQLDVEEKAELDAAMERAWAGLPHRYEWLRNWEYV